MQTKKEDGLKTNEPSIDEQLRLFADLLIDIYFETENIVIQNEEKQS